MTSLLLLPALALGLLGAHFYRAAAWPLVYLAPILGGLIATGLLWQAQRPRRRREGGGAAEGA